MEDRGAEVTVRTPTMTFTIQVVGPMKRSTFHEAAPDATSEVISDILHWSWSTRLQIRRFGESLRGDFGWNARPQLRLRRLSSQMSYDEHILYVAAAHLDRALSRAPRVVRDEVQLSKEWRRAITLLRHIYEHWDTARAELRRKDRPPRRSLKKLRDEFPKADPWTFTFDPATGEVVLADVVPLRPLRAELRGLEARMLRLQRRRARARRAELRSGRDESPDVDGKSEEGQMRSVGPADTSLDPTAADPSVIQERATRLKRDTPEQTLQAIYLHLKSELTIATAWNDPIRRRINSSDMLLQKRAWGCSAHAQVACHLARACGIPAILVKALDLDWIETKNRGDGKASGHVYVEVLIDGKPCLWDAQGGTLHRDYDPSGTITPGGQKRIYDKGSPEAIVLSHHGVVWEQETRRLYPAPTGRA